MTFLDDGSTGVAGATDGTRASVGTAGACPGASGTCSAEGDPTPWVSEPRAKKMPAPSAATANAPPTHGASDPDAVVAFGPAVPSEPVPLAGVGVAGGRATPMARAMRSESSRDG